MKKNLLNCLMSLCLISGLNAQINSVPGPPKNWSDPTAWVGGVVPTSTDVVNIVSNSNITVDFPLIHDADINVMGGMLASNNPLNNLTLNNANLSLTNFSSVVSFMGSGSAVPITINNGHLINGGVLMCGTLTISFASTGSNSVNNGDFMVSGDMILSGTELFINNLSMNVFNLMNIGAGCAWNNNQSANIGRVVNDGSVSNASNVTITDSLQNSIGANFTSGSSTISIGSQLNNYGSFTLNDSIDVGNNFNNYGTFTNNGGGLNIQNDFYNNGTLTGSLNGNYYIANNSENDVSGAINGDIDVCDATLSPGTYLDIDNGMSNIDFNTVDFCSTNLAGVEQEMLNNFYVYPNPFNDKITIENVENSVLELYDIAGKLKFSVHSVNNTISIPTEDLTTGIYLLKISKQGEIHQVKLIK